MIPIANRLDHTNEYYFSSKLREVKTLQQQGKPIINLAIGSPDLPPDQSVIDAIQNAVKQDNAHQYQSYQGIPELRQAMSQFYQTNYNVNLDPNTEILPLMGSKEGIMHISMAFLNPNDQVLIPNPGYPTYTSVTNLVGAIPLYYDLLPQNNWQPDFQKLEQQNLENVKIMWVNYPNMPTGEAGNLDLYQKLINFAKKHKILIINDNPYSLVLNQNPISILQIPEAQTHVLELNSLSKTYNMAGWRVGMVCGSTNLLTPILTVKSNMDSGMFFGIQKGAIAALQLPKTWLDTQNITYNNRRKLIFELAHHLNCSFDTHAVGLFVWAKLPPQITDTEQFVNDLLYQKNIFITPGTIFGSNGNGYIRFSLCQNEHQIQEAINRIKT